ncbi:SpoIIE family protein phosphatase [Candidatus Ozemobacteraceae bacterium]|nr:SpoIIE family protein phosphatase [Candidatus Ozemobacteraceae bacterium]
MMQTPTIGRWLFRLLLWLGFPTLVIGVALDIGIDSSRRSARNAVFEKMERAFTELQAEADSQIFFQRELEDVFGSVRGLAARPEAVDAVVRGFSGKWPSGSIDIHVFGGSGTLIPRRTSPPDIQEFMDRIRLDWTHHLEAPATITQRLSQIIPAPETLMRTMKGRPGKAVQLGGSLAFSWGYHLFQNGIPEQRVAGMLAFIHQQKLPPRFIPERVRQRLGLGETVIAGDDECDVAIPGMTGRTPLVKLKQLQALAADDRIVLEDRLVSLKRLDDTTLVVSSAADPGYSKGLLLVIAAFYTLIIIFICIKSYTFTFGSSNVSLPVWGKLLLFFGLGFGFPLMLSSSLALLYLGERHEGIREDLCQEAFRHLSALDARFAPHLTLRRLEYDRMCRDAERRLAGAGLDLGAFRRMFDEFRFDGMRIVASSGQSLQTSRIILAEMRRCVSLPKAERVKLFQSFVERGLIPTPLEVEAIIHGSEALDRGTAEGSRVENMIARAAVQAGKLAMDQANADRGLSGARQSSTADMVVDSVLEDDAKELIQGVRTGLRRFVSVSSGASMAQLYIDVIAGPAGDAWYALFIFHNLITLEMNFLETLFARAASDGYRPDDESPLRLHAVSWHHQGRCFPNQQDHRRFSKLLTQLNRSSNAVSLTMDLDGAPHLVCALPATALKHYALLAIVPIAELDRRFGEVSAQVWGCVAVLALFGLGVLTALWSRVVTPIAAITAGLESMKKGRYDSPVPVTGTDELGQMCAAVNQAMERLKEMELARTVQADLLPQNRLDLGPYLVQGRNSMIQAVGGDYFDFIPLHRGLTAVILGDVTGHGVSAALVTAMAKAAFTILCPRYPDQPEEVLQRLNRLMLSILNRSKMMSCFLGILDVQAKRMMAANAGQCYPILMPIGGAAAQISMPSQPLGTRVKAVFKRLDIDLRNAGLLLYSDGLVEAMSPDRTMFGYDSVTAAAGQLRRETGRSVSSDTDLLAPLFARLQAHIGAGSCNDDVTLVVIMPRD